MLAARGAGVGKLLARLICPNLIERLAVVGRSAGAGGPINQKQ